MKRKLGEAAWPPIQHEILADVVLIVSGWESHEGVEQFSKGMRMRVTKKRTGRYVAESPAQV